MTNNNQSDLTPCLWDAPHEPYHLKPVNARHYFHEQLKWDALHALPKNQQKTNTFLCNKCGNRVAFAVSKSGSRYLCDVKTKSHRYGRRGRHRSYDLIYYPYLWHSKSCTPTADGSVHPEALQYQNRTAQLMAERDAASPAPVELTADDWREVNDELVYGATRDGF